ncbi:MAG: ROK family transcriptional regulator [Spirochaetales bacterium]|nr:ROK family transcriptional regulator [Spirochaetales bacterium]
MRFSRPSTARQVNRLRVLNLLSLRENLSRADVARILGLNKVSTSEIVDALIEEKLIGEGATKATTTGRPPTILELQKEQRTIFAVDLESTNTSVALVNLMGEMLRYERFPTPKQPKPEEIAASIIQTVKKFLSRMREPDSVAGMVTSLNATVETATGTIIDAPQWGWHNVPFVFALSKHLPFKVVIENNTKALIFGERWFGNLEPTTSYYYLNWGETLTGAFFSEGKVNVESLLGHIPMGTNKRCRCGSIGCLETVSGGWALLEEFGETTSLRQLVSLRKAKDSLQTAANYLAKGLTYVATILRPEKILIGGPLAALPEKLFNSITEQFEREVSPLITNTEIVESALGEQSGVLGAASIGLDEFIFRRSLLEQIKTAFR